MIRTVGEACASLRESRVAFERYDHPPVATCEEASRHLHGVAGAGSKNLFLRNKKGDRHFLVTVREEIRVDLAKLSELLCEGRLSFASPERLERYLGVKPGAVTILALVNDSAGHVAAFIDRGLVEGELMQCHPMENTSTLVVSPSEVLRYLSEKGRTVKILDVPAMEG